MLSPITAVPDVAAEAPPVDFADTSLFFDFDGTLVDLAATPDAVVVGTGLIDLLRRHAARAPGRVAIVSGRSLDQLDAMLGDFAREVAVAGSHGADIRLPGKDHVAAARPDTLDRAIGDLSVFADAHGVLLERKSHGAALHYREKPDAGPASLATAQAIAADTGLVLQRGKMMVELRAPGDKGHAVVALLATPAMAGTRPLFFGDDVTDEDGFVAAAAAGGAGVLVGAARPSAARHRLPDVAAVHAWMTAALEARA